MSNRERFLAPVEFLYGAYVENWQPSPPILPHSHPDYWQLESAVAAGFYLTAGGIEKFFAPGQAVFIPPQTTHQFRYNRGGNCFITLKFRTDQSFHKLPLLELPDTPTARYLLQTLTQLQQTQPPAGSELTEYALGALFDHTYGLHQSAEPAIINLVREQLFSGTRIPSIKEVADKCGYSRDHLNRMVQKHLGMSIKAFADQELAKRARRALRYSERNISEVAEELGFPSVYAFSRFFSRLHHGVSPSKFRQQN